MGIGAPNGRGEHSALFSELLTHMRLAREWLDRCLDEIPVGRFDIYGFSVAFDAQRLPSLALARRLKERESKCKILFGGTAVDGVMGMELLRSFSWVDAVSQGDADWRIGELVDTLRGGDNVAAISGMVFRCEGRVVATPQEPPTENLDDLPIPDYDAFLIQLAASDWRQEAPFILFEASRGCWWGEKHHCRFCGLRADGLHFRRKSAPRVTGELELLAQRYPQHHLLYATDAILDFRAIQSLLPKLAASWERSRWKLFFEIKSNLGRREIALLADAGVTSVQPGIENFSDRVLSLMDKGSTGSRNVELLKWLAAHGVTPIYGLMVGTPGETAEDYEETIDLLPYLHHLPPPAQVTFLQLHRFSPYFSEPGRFGMTQVGPEEAYRIIYPDPSIELDHLVYRFQFASPEQAEPRLRATWTKLEAALAEWRRQHSKRGLWWREQGNAISLIELRNDKLASQTLTGSAAQLYRLCDRAVALDKLFCQLPQPARATVRACLERWQRRGWVYRFRSGAYLSLAVRLELRSIEHTSAGGARPVWRNTRRAGALAMHSQGTTDILLVTMPWATAIHPSLGLGLLSAILHEAGVSTSTLYGNLLLPRPSSRSIYSIDDGREYDDRSAGLAFVPHLYPHVDAEPIAIAVAERFIDMRAERLSIFVFLTVRAMERFRTENIRK